MNNVNNPTRVVIDLDGSLDELDDDDITLPDLPSAKDIPIIETPRVEEREEVIPALHTKPQSKPVEPEVPPGSTLSDKRPESTTTRIARAASGSPLMFSYLLPAMLLFFIAEHDHLKPLN